MAKSLSTVYGVKEGDVIGLCSENRLEFPVVVFAAFCLGATIAPLNVTYTDRKCSHWNSLKRHILRFNCLKTKTKKKKFCNVLLIIILHICMFFAGEFDHAINLSRPKLIFASSAVIKRAARISEKNAFVQKVIRIDSSSSGKQFTSKITTSYDKLVGSIKVGFVLITFAFAMNSLSTHFFFC